MADFQGPNKICPSSLLFATQSFVNMAKPGEKCPDICDQIFMERRGVARIIERLIGKTQCETRLSCI